GKPNAPVARLPSRRMTAAAALARQRAVGGSIKNRVGEVILIYTKDSLVRTAPQVLLFVFEYAIDNVGRIRERNKLAVAKPVKTAAVGADPQIARRVFVK